MSAPRANAGVDLLDSLREAGIPAELARVAIAFNLISDRVDWRAPQLCYASPAGSLEFCPRELSRHVVLRHAAPLHEFTLHVYRDAPVH